MGLEICLESSWIAFNRAATHLKAERCKVGMGLGILSKSSSFAVISAAARFKRRTLQSWDGAGIFLKIVVVFRVKLGLGICLNSVRRLQLSNSTRCVKKR